MKLPLLITACLAAALAAGCQPSGEKPAGRTTEQELAQALATETARQKQNQVFAQRSVFVATMQAQLLELNRNLEEFSDKIAKSNVAVKAELTPKLAALREQATRIRRKLGEATNATPATWSVIRTDSEQAYAALHEGLTRAREWARDQIAP